MKRLSVNLEDLHIMNPAFIDMETESSTHYVKTLDSCSSGIDDQHVPARIPNHLQDMRMTAYEYVRTILVNELARSGIIASGIASDMGHQHLHAFADKETVHGMGESEVMIVTVAGHPDQRFEFCDLSGQSQSTAEVARMPYLVDRGEEFAELRGEYSVGIRNKSYMHIRV